MPHFYLPDGTPYHTCLDAKGKERDTTLADARKVGAFLSVTGYLDVVSNPALLMWAKNLIREGKNENLVKEWAAKWGSKFHDMAETWLKTGKVKRGNKMQNKSLRNFINYWENDLGTPELLWSEKTFSHVRKINKMKCGFGGCIDLLFRMKDGTLVLADFKTKEGLPHKAYDQNILQLAAYSWGVKDHFKFPDKWLIIYVNRNTGEIKPIEMDEDKSYCDQFDCLLRYKWTEWMRSPKGYNI